MNRPIGLTQMEAFQLQKKFGKNQISETEKMSLWPKIARIIKEPMLVLLVVIALIYLIIGNVTEGLMLSVSALFVVGISLYQEQRSEKALASLRNLSSPRALVIRDSVEQRISATELVPGDLVLLNEGDRVPADGSVLSPSTLQVDESLLNGESVPVPKILNNITLNSEPLKLKVFASTLVAAGQAMMQVTQTGDNTEVGKIGKNLGKIQSRDDTSLSKEIQVLVRWFALIGFAVSLAVVVLYGIKTNHWLQAILIGLATEMALLPEEFPVVLAVFLALGAWRLSKVKVLIRNPRATERLGAITVLCVDKTGTLTQNRMRLAAVASGADPAAMAFNESVKPSAEVLALIQYAALASQPNAVDPMEKELQRISETKNSDFSKSDNTIFQTQLVRQYPLSSTLFAMTNFWKNSDNSYIAASKGSPEAIAKLCRLEPRELQKIETQTREMALRGYRVLGVAQASQSNQLAPENQSGFAFKWLGLLGFEDPLRKEVPAAVQLCQRAGIRVLMMTGDHPATALEVAKQAGINTTGGVTLGNDFELFDNATAHEKIVKSSIFARMNPIQKLRLVELLKGSGYIIAMTGDGVNDAPSLKAANVGISMGMRGTDVAKEASDIVLLDDNFASIVAGVKRGRSIFSNIKNAITYIISIHVPIAGLAALPVLFDWPLILMPAHIVFLELIIDPVCSLMFEAQDLDDEIMSLPPRRLNSNLLSPLDMLRSFLQGVLVLIFTGMAFWIAFKKFNQEEALARTFTFAILVTCNLGLIFSDLGGGSKNQMRNVFKKPNNRYIAFTILVALFAVTQIRWLGQLFHFEPMNMIQIVMCIAFGITTFLVVSFWNYVSKKRTSIAPKILVTR
jgi:P-type Ca2+ transporter type 2C